MTHTGPDDEPRVTLNHSAFTGMYDELNDVREERDRLIAALEPFAKAAAHMRDFSDYIGAKAMAQGNYYDVFGDITVGDFRRAAASLPLDKRQPHPHHSSRERR